MKKLYGSLLIIIGSFLEIYFYFFRFKGDGSSWWLSAIIGVGLTILLTAFFLEKVTWKILIGIGLLFIFSVISTSNGQAASFAELEIKENQKIIDTLIASDLLEYNRLEAQYKTLESAFSTTITELEDVYEYKNTTPATIKLMEDLSRKMSAAQSRISAVKDKYSVTIKRKPLYKFYAEIPTWCPESWLQFSFQTFLSMFIAIMAPYGITLIKQKKTFILNEWINTAETWIKFNWFILSRNEIDLISMDKFMELLERKGKSMTFEQYNKIKKLANGSNIIKNNKIIEGNQKQAFAKLLDYMSRR